VETVAPVVGELDGAEPETEAPDAPVLDAAGGAVLEPEPAVEDCEGTGFVLRKKRKKKKTDNQNDFRGGIRRQRR
jgi:hypothetical protein